MNTSIKCALISAAILFAVATSYAELDQTTQNIFKNLMGAVVSNDYNAFIAECDAPMKAAMTHPMLDVVNKQIEPRAKPGYDAFYLGELKKEGYQVHLWRLRFKDGGDDILATLSVKEGKVGGFYLK
jgi:hypothetical protein